MINMDTLVFFAGFLALFIADVSSMSMANIYCTQHTNVYVNLTKVGTTRIATRTMDDGEDQYSDNLICSWNVDAGEGYRVHVSVDVFDVSPLPVTNNSVGTCYETTYAAVKEEEIMDSFDWLNSDPGMYYLMCHHRYPSEFTSKNRDLIIEFGSKINTGNYRGIHFIASRFPLGQCPYNWVQRESSNGMAYCYKVFNKVTTWAGAQEICTMQQGNLVSIVDQEEEIFVNELASNSSTLYPDIVQMWSIGLHDVYNKGQYRWISQDNTTMDYSSKWSSASKEADPSVYKCTALNADGTWEKISCYSHTYRFICKAQRDGESMMYKIPLVKTDRITPPTPSSASFICYHSFWLTLTVLLSIMM